MRIPLSRPTIDEQDISAVEEVLKSGWVSSGRYNKLFEEEFSKYIGVSNCISMNSCTSTIFVTLKILAKNRGNIIVPSFTFPATINAIINANLEPVISDVNLKTMNIDASQILEVINDQTIGILLVHFAGNPCKMREIIELANDRNLFIIEDCAHAIGTYYDSKHAGSWGVGCFSFFATKNITTGEGGILSTNDDELASLAKKYISHGIIKSFENTIPKREAEIAGQNFRMSGIQGALGSSQLKKFSSMTKKRAYFAKRYEKHLRDIDEIIVPEVCSNGIHSWHMYIIRILDRELRNWMFAWLKRNNIEASIHYYPALHNQNIYKRYTTRKLNYENTQELENSVLTLPMFPNMKNEEQNYIIKMIKAGVQRWKKK